MVTHTFVCDACGIKIKHPDCRTEHVCRLCKATMRWELGNIGISDGDYYHESDSLAIHPDQIPEHKELFPDVDVTPDGRPAFTSARQQEKYAHACGFDKQIQRGRNLGRVTL